MNGGDDHDQPREKRWSQEGSGTHKAGGSAPPAQASSRTDGAQHCSAQQLVFGAVKLNINHGYGSGCTRPQGGDSWREAGLGTTQLYLLLRT